MPQWEKIEPNERHVAQRHKEKKNGCRSLQGGTRLEIQQAQVPGDHEQREIDLLWRVDESDACGTHRKYQGERRDEQRICAAKNRSQQYLKRRYRDDDCCQKTGDAIPDNAVSHGKKYDMHE